MSICDVCGHLTDRPEVHPGPYGMRLVCPLCAGLGATHLTIVPDPEGADHEHGGTGTLRC
jgi:hypothetical protein